MVTGLQNTEGCTRRYNSHSHPVPTPEGQDPCACFPTPRIVTTQEVPRCAWNSWLCEPLLCEHRWHVCVRQGVCPHPRWGPWGGERLAVGQLPGLQVLSAACSMLGAGHLPGCRCSGKGDVIHQGDKAADERWASEQLFLSSSWNGCWRRGGEGKRGKAHSEIKNDGPAGG